METKKETTWEDMDDFTAQYAETALWSSCDENANPLDDNYDVIDLASETIASMIEDCNDFRESNSDLLDRAYDETSNDPAQAAIDFWLTRNGHGAGFWDGAWGSFGDDLTKAAKAYGSIDLYVGDDGLVYSS